MKSKTFLSCFLFSLAVALTSGTMISCGQNNPASPIDDSGEKDDDGGQGGEEHHEEDDKKDPIYLATPSLSLDKNNNKVTWSAIENASFYRYYINNGDYKETNQTSVDLKDGESISVMADSNEEYIYPSNWSNPISNVTISEEDKYITISFKDACAMSNAEEVRYPNQVVIKGREYTAPTDVVKADYTFVGWYLDPFFKDSYVNGSILTKDTMLYAKWEEPSYLKDTYYYIKCNEHISNEEKGYWANSSWGFIPLRYDAQKSSELGNRKAYSTIVTASNVTSDDYAKYLIMDGVDDLAGRKYWKRYNDSDFTLKSDGTYKITFSVEYEWSDGDGTCHAHADSAVKQSIRLSRTKELASSETLNTPVLSLDKATSKVNWTAVDGATKYEYSIDGKAIQETDTCSLTLYQGQYIILRAVNGNDNYASKWTAPVIYPYDKVETNNNIYVTFYGLDRPSVKIDKDTKISRPTDPVKSGYTFDNWYSDLAHTKIFDFDDKITKNTVVYAKFDIITDFERYEVVDANNNRLTTLKYNDKQKAFTEYFGKLIIHEATTLTVREIAKPEIVLYTQEVTDPVAEYQVCFSLDNIYSNNKYCSISHTRYNLYFSFSFGSGQGFAYAWRKVDGKTQRNGDWPGVGMEYVKENSYGQDIYKINIYKDYYENIIFSRSDIQTVDISLKDVVDGTQWWSTGTNSEGKHKVASGIYGD